MKTAIFTVSMMFVLSLTGCGQLTKMLEQQISDNTTKISGTATLHNQTNHSGITVKMGKQVQAQTLGISAQSVTASFTTVATTGSSGVFSFDVTMAGATASSVHANSIDLSTGLYTVVFSKDGYESVTVDNVPVVLGQSVYNMDDIELKEIVTSYPFPVSSAGYMQVYSYIGNPNDSVYRKPFKIQAIQNRVNRFDGSIIIDNSAINDNDVFKISMTNPKNDGIEFYSETLTWSELKNKVFDYDSQYSQYSYIINIKSLTDHSTEPEVVLVLQ